MKFSPSQVTVCIFWIGFLSFISVSIPHVAWLYQINQPSEWYTVVTSYGVAIGVDVLIAWLSFMCARGKMVDVGVTVAFILLLSSLSYYANFLYDQYHNPTIGEKVWSVSIFFGVTTTGYLTPLVTSAIPFFSLAYTFMLSRLTNSKIDLVAMEVSLKQKAAVKQLKEKYQEANKTSLEDKAKGVITGIVNVGKHAINQVSKEQSEEIQPDIQIEVKEEVKTESDTSLNDTSGDTSTSLTSVRNITLDEAAKLLQYDVKTVKKMLSQGKLNSPNGSKQYITRASVNALLQKKQGTNKGQFRSPSIENQKTSPQTTDEIPVLHLVNS